MTAHLKPKKVAPKSTEVLAAEWDALAASRLDQLTKGQDISLNYILLPALLKLLGEEGGDALLDVGCGTGYLTVKFASRFNKVVAIDPSARSIELAKKLGETHPNVTFLNVSIEDFISEGSGFSAILANMTLMDVTDLSAALHAMARLSRPGGHLVFSITHPFFWPAYWGYLDAEWFTYSDEVYIESEFKITNASTGLVTTHVHRPLQAYIEAVVGAGIAIKQILEPLPPAPIQSVYRDAWGRTPRFMIFDCELPL